MIGLLLTLASCAGKPVQETPVAASPSAPVEVKKPQVQVDENSAIGKALKSSAEKKKFLVALFYEKDDESTGAMKTVFAAAEKKFGKERANFVTVNVALKEERSAVDKYEIDKVKKPVLLVLSPEGSVINGFIQKTSLSQIEESFLSEKVLTFLKSAQERNLIFVCFPGQDPAQYEKNVKEIEAYAGQKGNSVVINVNPEDKDDAPLYSIFKMTPGKAPQAVVTILNQGALAGTLKGAVDAAKIDALLASCTNCATG
jgi:hypothetical protein